MSAVTLSPSTDVTRGDLRLVMNAGFSDYAVSIILTAGAFDRMLPEWRSQGISTRIGEAVLEAAREASGEAALRVFGFGAFLKDIGAPPAIQHNEPGMRL